MRFIGPALLLVVSAASVAAVSFVSGCGSFGADDPSGPDTSEAGAAEAGAAEGGGAEGGGACALGTSPALVASASSVPSKLQASGAELFWIEGDTRLMRASLTDCTTTEVANGNITALAVDSTWIVWGEPGYHALARSDVGSTVMPKTHATTVSPSLILAGGTAFWLDPGSVASCATPCVSTTTAAVLDQPQLLTANASRFFVFGLDREAGTAGTLSWQPIVLSGNDVLTSIAINQDPILLAANSARVFWMTTGGKLLGIPAGGGAPIPLPDVQDARALAVDETFVYAATSTTIGRVPVTGGGDLTPVVMGESGIRALVVTSDAIIWATDTAIRRVRKK